MPNFASMPFVYGMAAGVRYFGIQIRRSVCSPSSTRNSMVKPGVPVFAVISPPFTARAVYVPVGSGPKSSAGVVKSNRSRMSPPPPAAADTIPVSGFRSCMCVFSRTRRIVPAGFVFRLKGFESQS